MLYPPNLISVTFPTLAPFSFSASPSSLKIWARNCLTWGASSRGHLWRESACLQTLCYVPFWAPNTRSAWILELTWSKSRRKTLKRYLKGLKESSAMTLLCNLAKLSTQILICNETTCQRHGHIVFRSGIYCPTSFSPLSALLLSLAFNNVPLLLCCIHFLVTSN